MKIAIVHDYIKEYGGAERVLEALHEIWPEAPVYTTVYLPEFLGPHKERFKGWDIKTSFLQYIPLKEKLISPFRVLAPFVFRMFDLSDYDIVIVSATGAYIPNVISNINPRLDRGQIPNIQIKNQKFKKRLIVTYCHTPPRYLYGYATARNWKKNIIFRAIGGIGNHFLRLVDYRSAQNVDYFIANSKNVAGRIKKFYRRDAKVIYPPVDILLGSPLTLTDSSKPSGNTRLINEKTSNYTAAWWSNTGSKRTIKSSFRAESRPSKGYFLAGGRLARPKHIDLIVRACQELKVPLKVFGRGFANENIKYQISNIKYTNKKSKIEYLGEVSDEEKMELMRSTKAYIFAGEDEDFGITPVEAMMCGTPVIAYRSGGVVESVVDGKTGLFFDELTVESLSEAIKRFTKFTKDTPYPGSILRNHGQKFSKENFKKKIKKFVYEIGNTRSS